MGPCKYCHKDFADHNYVKDSINVYECPVKMQETIYGFFSGGDPKLFHPDAESCTPKELRDHAKACLTVDEVVNPSGWFEGGHVTMAPFGIGVTVIEFQTTFEERECKDAQRDDTNTDVM